ncbi:hypothetical protein ACRAWD_18615 [Caulobacter segnis]
MTTRRSVLAGASALVFAALARPAASQGKNGAPILTISAPMAPPEWALLQRQLLKANEEACAAFFERYFDERGWLRAVERWAPTTAPTTPSRTSTTGRRCTPWAPVTPFWLMAKKAFDGNVAQYTAARTKDVPFAREGMYFREFPVMTDWQHLSEGLSAVQPAGPVRSLRRQVSRPGEALLGLLYG